MHINVLYYLLTIKSVSLTKEKVLLSDNHIKAWHIFRVWEVNERITVTSASFNGDWTATLVALK